MKTLVVHCKEEPFDIYIARAMPGLPASKWANGYHIGTDGTRDEVCDKHERDLINDQQLFSELPELRGKKIGCWCKGKRTPNIRCHGDTYVKYLSMMFPEDALEYQEAGHNAATEQLALF